jgi:processive 1,2-diacylglycerol beta-glucosyltransferase
MENLNHLSRRRLLANKRVLFISAPIGAGHIRAAQAVSHELRVNHACQTELCNVFDLFPPFIGQTILNVYLKILDFFPAIYGSAYSWGNQSRLALFGREMINQILARRMLQYIKEYQPDVIVCTHATPAGLVAWLRKKNLITIPALAIITDFVVHRLWVYPEISCYFVAHPAMADYLHQQGIAREAIAVTGIPISESFSRPTNKYELLTKLKLSQDRKTIMIMGGGAGVLPLKQILEFCSQIDKPLQFIAVAGKNQALCRELLAVKSTFKHPVKVLGYVDNIHEFMNIADLLISKPGGMTAAEALAQGVPLIIFRPIPGQELANTQYLLDNGAALRADSLSDLKTILNKLLFEENDDLSSLHKGAVLIGRPAAAKDVARIILNNHFC